MSLTTKDLIDRAEILEALTNYSQALDQRHWELLDKAFLPDATFTSPPSRTEPISPAGLREHLIADNDPTRLSGQHLLTNTNYQIKGDKAHTVTEVVYITLQRSHIENVVYEVKAGGLYVDDLVRVEDGWRIAKRVLATKHKETRHITYTSTQLEAITDTLNGDWF